MTKKGNAVAKPMEPVSSEPKPKPRQASSRPLDMYCRCLADPEGSPPCRVPDDYMVPSIAQKSVEEYIVTSDANGFAYGSIAPSLIRGIYTSTTIGVGTAGVVDGTTYRTCSDYNTLIASSTYGRLVTYQVTITYIGPSNTCAGRICIVSDSQMVSYGVGTKVTDMFDDGVSGPSAEGAFIRMRPRQTPRMEDLTGTTFMAPTFDTAYYGGAGLPPNTACFSVRVTKHLELVPIKNSLWRNVAALEPYNPFVMAQSVNMGQAGTTGSATQRGAAAQVAIAAAHGAWNYLKSDIKALAGEAGYYAGGVAKGALLALMP